MFDEALDMFLKKTNSLVFLLLVLVYFAWTTLIYLFDFYWLKYLITLEGLWFYYCFYEILITKSRF